MQATGRLILRNLKLNVTHSKLARLSQKSLTSPTLIERTPVVTIMGHVDHGKTTLLDSLRNSQIVKQEFGGITQHIGAFVVPFKQRDHTEYITFLDTPGHAAFAAMRQRGAEVTDIVILVVACDDGVLDQTVESIKYAKNSKVALIVAINKVDKFDDKPKELEKNFDLIRKQLVVHDVVLECDGGDVQVVKISALNNRGINELKEAILALAETLDLKAEIDCPVRGHVIESSIDQHRGKLCTVLVDAGQLNKGDYIVAGTSNWAKIRALFDERGRLRQSCNPGEPIQVTGWRENVLPSAGDPIMQVASENEAKSIIHTFRQDETMKKAERDAQESSKRAEEYQKLYRAKLTEKRESGRRYGRIFFNPRGQRPKETEQDEFESKKVNVILKCDVDGSLDAILDLLDTYDRDNKQPVKLDLMHHGVGSITDNDYNLATMFPNSVIYGFNVRVADQKILLQAKRDNVSVKLFNVIYHLIDDLKARLSDKIPEVEKEAELGRADCLQEFVVTEKKKRKIHVAGCRCSRGLLKKSNVRYKIVRNHEVIHDELIVKSLMHLKDEVQEIEKDKECGIAFEGPQVEFKPGDTLICFERYKKKPKLKWDLKGFS